VGSELRLKPVYQSDSHLDSNPHLISSKAKVLVSRATLLLSLWFHSVIMMQRKARDINKANALRVWYPSSWRVTYAVFLSFLGHGVQ